LFGVEPDIDINYSSIENPCENKFEEKSVSGVEPDIDINLSSIQKPSEGLFEKEEDGSRKNEEYLTTPPTSIGEKESLKGDCNTLNSHLNHNAYSYSQKSQKQHFMMLLLILGNEQLKRSKNIFDNGPISFQQNFYKNSKGPYFLTILFEYSSLNFLISLFFHVYCRLIFDPRGRA